MTPNPLLNLVERVEAADGPLAEEIALSAMDDAWKLLNPMPARRRVPTMADGSPWPGDGIGPYTPEATAWEAKRKSFTRLVKAGASLDAAMTLVPEGWRVGELEENWRSGRWHCRMTERPSEKLIRAFDEGKTIGYESKEAEAATAALALTAAALRAHAQKEGE